LFIFLGWKLYFTYGNSKVKAKCIQLQEKLWQKTFLVFIFIVFYFVLFYFLICFIFIYFWMETLFHLWE